MAILNSVPDFSIDWSESIPFGLVHLAAIVGVFLVPFHWSLVALAAASYFVRMFFVTAGYHRYFSHRAYKASRAVQLALAVGASTTAQKGVLWWAANHRHHHRFSDQEKDIHSPVRDGFWWSHVGWILSKGYQETMWESIPDFAKFPELRWLNRFHLVPAFAYAIAFFLVGGWPALAWGFFVSTVLLWHGTFTINSLSHVFGSRRYATTDTSKNNPALAFITLGEGWHNNHHCYQSSANQGFFWWEIDLTYLTLKALRAVGLVHDLRKPPLALLEAKRVTQVSTKRWLRPFRYRSSDLRTQTPIPPSEASSHPAAETPTALTV